VEIREDLEDGVEVVGWEIVEVDAELRWWGIGEFSGGLVDGFHHFSDG